MTKETIYCDRCGQECEKMRNNKGLHLFRTRLFVKTAGDDWLDLCQKCYDSLDKWWYEEIKTHRERSD